MSGQGRGIATAVILSVILSSWLNFGMIIMIPQVRESLRGPQGLQGPQGIQGPQGPRGLTGLKGPQGIHGPTGFTGAQGPQGPQGPESPAGTWGVPDFDSNWVSIDPGGKRELYHDLGSYDLLVYIVGRSSTEPFTYHQYYFGGVKLRTDKMWGVYWKQSDENALWVFRFEHDDWWDEVRVRIWLIPS